MKSKSTKCIKLHTRRQYIEIYIEKLTYIGEILRINFRDNAEGSCLWTLKKFFIEWKIMRYTKMSKHEISFNES